MQRGFELRYPAPRRVWDTDFHQRPALWFDRTESTTPVTHFLQLVISGRQVLRTQQTAFECRRGDVNLFLAGERYDYLRTSPTLRTLTIFFEKLPADRVLPPRKTPAPATASDRIRIPLHLPAARAEALGDPFHLMHQLCIQRSAAGDRPSHRLLNWQCEVQLIRILLTVSASMAPRSIPLSQPPEIRRIIRRITASPGERHSLAELSEWSGIPPSTLKRRFRKVTGWTIKQFQSRVRVQQARQILKLEPDVPLREIADRLGFYDEFHLSRTFRRLSGLTPSAYRARFPAA